MNASSIFTRSRMGLDTRVWLTMIVTIALSFILVGFKMAFTTSCVSMPITIKNVTAGKPNTYYLGQTIHFTIAGGKGKEITWDFGDNKMTTKGDSVMHTYLTEGNFTVTATINGKCKEMTSLVIVQLGNSKPVSVQEPVETTPITGPDAPHAGEPVNFTCEDAADSYEWSIVNAPNFAIQSAPVATYTFPVPGTQTIELKLNHDDKKVYHKTIQVLPSNKTEKTTATNMPVAPVVPPPSLPEKKQEPKPETPKVTVIADEEFKNMFDAVVEGKKDASSFNQFLCNGGETNVLLNGDTWETVATFCTKIHDKKKFVIKSVKVIRNETNCVSVLKIEYKKKLIAF